MVVKRRLIIWLIRAYITRWWKVILISFISGLGIFFLLLLGVSKIGSTVHIEKKATLGLIGDTYTVDNLPRIITAKIARGLTRVAPDSSIAPDLASSWELRDNGKTYIFHLDKTKRFHDGTPVTSDRITYNFSGITVARPDKYTIIYTLKEPYSPFLVTVTRPIFKEGLIAAGEYKVSRLELNGNFVKSIRLAYVKNLLKIEDYQFYPSEDVLKIAFALGEVTHAYGLTNDNFKDTTFSTFPKVVAKKVVDYENLVTMFYNTQDAALSDKKLRNGLTFALPDSFPQGKRNYLPYAPESRYYNVELQNRRGNLTRAKSLMESLPEGTLLEIKTLPKYRKAADTIVKAWEKIGIKTKITEVDTVPVIFQIYIGDFMLPRDPDQYTLWHSDQPNNITKYKNLRIDKLLEDGRKVSNADERKQLYYDFQKYLLDDSPAAFLYFPYAYELERK